MTRLGCTPTPQQPTPQGSDQSDKVGLTPQPSLVLYNDGLAVRFAAQSVRVTPHRGPPTVGVQTPTICPFDEFGVSLAMTDYGLTG